jgi:hypothetical protein
LVYASKRCRRVCCGYPLPCAEGEDMKDIIELAKQAGFQQTSAVRIESPYIGGADLSFELERFAALVRAEVLEEAAGVCDELRHPWGYSAETPDWCRGTVYCADAIRALAKEKA